MAASTAPAARTKVLELLAASAALDGVKVTRGAPTEEENVKKELVYLGGRTERTTEPQGFGERFNEEYSFPVHIFVSRPGNDRAACEERGWELIDAVEQAIRGQMSLEGVLNMNAEFGEQTLEVDPVQGGWECMATVSVVCHAQI